MKRFEFDGQIQSWAYFFGIKFKFGSSAEIHQDLLSQFSLLADFVKVPVKDKDI
jgi:hypothetical protein